MWIRVEDDRAERGDRSDCLHGEDFGTSAIAIDGVDSRVGKVARRACSSMPTQQYADDIRCFFIVMGRAQGKCYQTNAMSREPV